MNSPLLFLAPPFILSSLKLSNRFVGPIHRLRQQLRQIADGQPFEDLKFRRGDFWQELADEMERAMAALRDPARNNVGSTDQAGRNASAGIVFPASEVSTTPGVHQTDVQ